MENELNPTLWRTCRMLANARRLRIIHQLIDKEPQTLTQLAKACKMSVSACSQYTRHITARGLCREIRNGRFAYFDLYADPAIPYSTSLLKAVIRSVKQSKRDYKQQLAELTAYTHISRIRIVRYIAQHGVCRICEMQSGLHISKPALIRHVNKLTRRNRLQAVKTGGYQLVQPTTVLARELLSIATGYRSHTS
jgi:predicted transcriptional regulator